MARSKKNPRKKISKTVINISKERRHRRATSITAVSHVTAEQFFNRHIHCVNVQDIQAMINHNPEMIEIIKANPAAHKAVCDHPEDGFCFHEFPSPEILQKINDKLAFKVARPPQEVQNDLVEEENVGASVATKEVVRSISAGKFTFTLGGNNDNT